MSQTKKRFHEFRDPIHVFIKLDSDERDVLDSPPFQRLRYIRQLATSYLVYPGATHTRFEHSLGVMELASRVFDVVTNPENVHKEICGLIPQIEKKEEKNYWRKVLRIAALCHDLGHLPFSHAGEKELLPVGWNHERITKEIILSEEMKKLWSQLTPPLRSDDIVKLAVGPNEASEFDFTDWETILSEIITGNSFGVDRMDYLLRDSYFTGVTYGKFDHYRLIDTLRILPPPISKCSDTSLEPFLGVEYGGLHSAEALSLARYFMFSQVYFHRVRRIYDIHLKDFLLEWLPDGKFPIEPLTQFLAYTDNEILAEIRESNDLSKSGFIHAQRIINRNQFFKRLYERNPDDIAVNPEAARSVYSESVKKYGDFNVRLDISAKEGGKLNFPVKMDDDRIVSSLALSRTLNEIPPVAVDFVFVNPPKINEAKEWLEKNRNDIIRIREGD